jgi:hypothetical protein
VVVWDNSNTHVSDAMAALIAARDWLTVYRLPPYAHELNPVEPVWSHLCRFTRGATRPSASVMCGNYPGALSGMGSRRGSLPVVAGSLTPGGGLSQSIPGQ